MAGFLGHSLGYFPGFMFPRVMGELPYWKVGEMMEAGFCIGEDVDIQPTSLAGDVTDSSVARNSRYVFMLMMLVP